MKSKLEVKNQIDYSKKIIVNKLETPQANIENIERILLRTLPDKVTLGELREEVRRKILRENAFEQIMNYLSLQFTFQISSSELNEIKRNVMEEFKASSITEETANKIAQKIIMKTLIFEYIANQNNIIITQQELDETIKKEKEIAPEQMKDFFSEKNSDKLRHMILEQKIVSFLLDKFKVEFDLK